MRIAVFADVHGRVELCFRLVARWEEEHAEPIHTILQAGDLGAFFDPSHLDKASVRHARRDPTERGFVESFARRDEVTAAALARTDCRMIFVRGNHEDHEVLDELEARHAGSPFPVDVYARVWCLPTGIPHVLADGNTALTLLGVGRVGPPDGEPDYWKAKYVQAGERERLDRLDIEGIDVLLTHDAARDSLVPGFGMQQIRDLIDVFGPAYHLHGHTGGPATDICGRNRMTRVCKLADLKWSAEGPVQNGSMAILTWNGSLDHSLEIVSDTWMHEYTAATWRHL